MTTVNLTVPYSHRYIFQKYAFMSPSIFMGIFSGLIFLFVLLAALSLLTSLQTPSKFDAGKKVK